MLGGSKKHAAGLSLGLGVLGAVLGVLLSQAPDGSTVRSIGDESSRAPLTRASSEVVNVEHDCEELWLEERVRCVFSPDHPLQLWIDDERSADVEVLVNGRVMAGLRPERSDVADIHGFGLEVVLPVDSSLLEVRVRGSSAAPWSLPLVSKGSEPRPPGVPTSIEVSAAFSKVYYECLLGDYQAAARTLEEIEPFALRFPKGRADLMTFRGIVQWHQRKLYDAVSSLREGVLFATKLDDEVLFEESAPLYAATLAELGYLEGAEFWAKRAVRMLHPPCEDAARLRSTLGWVGVMQAELRGHAPPETRQWLQEGLSLVATECPSDDILPGLALSMALLDLHEGKPSDALSRLLKIEYARVTHRDEEVRLRDARVQALLAMGRLEEANVALAELPHVVERGGGPEGRWRLALRRGDLHHARGRADDAMAAYREAESEVPKLMAISALGLGRQTAAFLHRQSHQRLVSSLVEQSRLEQAFCAAREAQARRLSGSNGLQRRELHTVIERYLSISEMLDRRYDEFRRGTVSEREDLDPQIADLERERNELLEKGLAAGVSAPACDELMARSADELLLGLVPIGREWFVFVQDRSETQAYRIEPSERSLEEILERVGDRVAEARRVRVLASGEAQDVDVHLLRWRGAALVQHVPVVYGAELPRTQAVAAARGGHPRTLIVADPTGTLPMAIPEVRVVEHMLRALGWTIDAPDPSEVDDALMRERLPAASLFYYAGHGEHDAGGVRAGMLPPYAGGTKAWPSHLVLVPPAVFETHEIQLLDAVPEHVALIGCETGVPDYLGGNSLALAFLQAGAEEVVATPDETDDVVGARTGVRLLLGASTGGIDLARGLQRAQKDLLDRGMEVGRYRVWVR